MRSLQLRSQSEWKAWSKSKRPTNIPSTPQKYYRDNGWVSWPDWLGYGGKRCRPTKGKRQGFLHRPLQEIVGSSSNICKVHHKWQPEALAPQGAKCSASLTQKAGLGTFYRSRKNGFSEEDKKADGDPGG